MPSTDDDHDQYLDMDEVERAEYVRQRAMCWGATSLFFPSEESDESTRMAKAICAGCPVASECLEGALSRREPDGVWGGLDTRERRRVLRLRTKAAKRAKK